MLECICAHCKEAFLIPGARVNQGEGKYCSLRCKHDACGLFGTLLNALPGTLSEISQKTGINLKSVRASMARLIDAGRAHFTGLIETTEHAGHGLERHALRFEAGPFPDDWVFPKKMRLAVPLMTEKLVLDAMPGNQIALAEKTGLCISTISVIVRRLHATEQCHIGRWKRPAKGTATPVYKSGKGKDVANNVVVFTMKEKTERWLKKATKNGRIVEYRQRRAQAQRTRYARANGDQLINALFGRPKERKAA